ncbi:MAG: hypothetical protein J3Q66DRAFT_326709 [Benniella sp.]|nr:MAG: hypothetical protein J3Q66DRAFT_326709 [Benniella sp.]
MSFPSSVLTASSPLPLPHVHSILSSGPPGSGTITNATYGTLRPSAPAASSTVTPSISTTAGLMPGSDAETPQGQQQQQQLAHLLLLQHQQQQQQALGGMASIDHSAVASLSSTIAASGLVLLPPPPLTTKNLTIHTSLLSTKQQLFQQQQQLQQLHHAQINAALRHQQQRQKQLQQSKNGASPLSMENCSPSALSDDTVGGEGDPRERESGASMDCAGAQAHGHGMKESRGDAGASPTLQLTSPSALASNSPSIFMSSKSRTS